MRSAGTDSGRAREPIQAAAEVRTSVSAGVSTAVGGHVKPGDTGQFEISDGRSVDEVCRMLRARGYQPVFKDWEPLEATA